MNNKGITTTIIAVAMTIAGMGLVAALIMDKIDKETFTIAIASVGTFGSTLIGYFAKDSNKSHTK